MSGDKLIAADREFLRQVGEAAAERLEEMFAADRERADRATENGEDAATAPDPADIIDRVWVRAHWRSRPRRYAS